MLERIAGLEIELRDVEIRLGDPARPVPTPPAWPIWGAVTSMLSEILAAGGRLRAAVDDLDEARRMHTAADRALRGLNCAR